MWDVSDPPYATSPSETSGSEFARTSNSRGTSVRLDGSDRPASDSPCPEGKSQMRVIKPHRKTRQGCFNCKRRKVKCSEERPGCIPCARNGLRCVFPLSREATIQFPNQVRDPQAQSMAQLHSGRLEYTALDMRLLHHFIIDAYPHLPLDCDSVWQRDIPALAHQYNYLMHSLLALAASHINRRGETNLAPAAHFHRLRAIEGVNQALNDLDRSADDDDALVSACYALVFQNAHTGDSPTGFWITVRTIATIGKEMKSKNRKTRFPSIGPSGHARVMTKRLENFPRLRRDLIYCGIESLQAMGSLCQYGLEQEMYSLLLETFYKLLQSSIKGYFCFASIYAMVATMSSCDFQRLTNSTEHVIQLLQCHFLALQSIMGPILTQEWAGRVERISSGPEKQDKSTARWADSLFSLDPNSPLRQHLEWTTKIRRKANDGSLFERIFEEDSALDVLECRGAWTEGLDVENCDAQVAGID